MMRSKNKQILVYTKDVELISLISKLLENKRIANKISNNSFHLLKNKFNSSKIYNDYLKIF